MRITFGEARKILAQYAGRGGKCPDTDEVARFVLQVLDYLLITDTSGNERKFCFQAQHGCFTAPPELETPVKVRIDGKVGTVWNRWYEWYGTHELDKCIPAASALLEDPNYYPTVYDIPSCGAYVVAVATCAEAEDAHIIIQGQDTSGRDVHTVHKGEPISGEYLSLAKHSPKRTHVRFGKITGIIKSKTNGYVQLFGLQNTAATELKNFLGDYSPLEEKPSYRRFRLTSPDCGSCVQVSLIGRIRLKSAYADSDYIPFESQYILSLAGQSVNKQYNDQVDVAKAKDLMMQDLIERENSYKKPQAGTPVEVFVPTSPGNIMNVIRTPFRRRGF